jgi:hypothetical protein
MPNKDGGISGKPPAVNPATPVPTSPKVARPDRTRRHRPD